MDQIRSNARRHGLLWVFCLATALVFVQIANLHLHSDDQHHQTYEGDLPGHTHFGVIHACGNYCGALSAHETATGIDLFPEGVPKKPSFDPTAMALLVPMIIFLLSNRLYKHRSGRWDEDLLFDSRRNVRHPPLRAPPR